MYVVETHLLGSEVTNGDSNAGTDVIRDVVPVFIRKCKENTPDNQRGAKRLVVKPVRYRTDFPSYVSEQKRKRRKNSYVSILKEHELASAENGEKCVEQNASTNEHWQKKQITPSRVMKYKFGIGTLNSKVLQPSQPPCQSSGQLTIVTTTSATTGKTSLAEHGYRVTSDVYSGIEQYRCWGYPHIEAYPPYGYYYTTVGLSPAPQTHQPQGLLMISTATNCATTSSMPETAVTSHSCRPRKLSDTSCSFFPHSLMRRLMLCVFCVVC